MNRQLVSLFLSVVVAVLVACGSRQPPDPSAVVQACQTLEAAQRAAIEQAATLVPAGQYAQAYTEFQNLKRKLPLDLEQEMAFNDLLLQLKKHLGKSAPPAAVVTNASAASQP